jgi:NOL1/NOP2/fmu family ribosome biogenesis protein
MGEGFFISVIRKKGKQESDHNGNHRKFELKPGKDDISIVKEWTHFPDERIFKRGNEVFAVPCAMDVYLHLFHNLKVVNAGTKIFEVKKNDYLPSHEIALSNYLKKDAFHKAEIDLSDAISYMRRDNFTIDNKIKGWIIVTYKGINIGFIKNIINRANNYFPVEWRVRMTPPVSGEENIIEWETKLLKD